MQTLIGWLLCRVGRHQLRYVRAHWYGRQYGRCRRCGQVVLPEAA